MSHFLGEGILFERNIGGKILEYMDDLRLTCLGFDFMGFNPIGIFFAGVLLNNVFFYGWPYGWPYGSL